MAGGEKQSTIGAEISDSRAALPLPVSGERSEFARSSRKFRVRGPLHESELCGKAIFALSESALADRPPHSDPLPASGEREQACTQPYLSANGPAYDSKFPSACYL